MRRSGAEIESGSLFFSPLFSPPPFSAPHQVPREKSQFTIRSRIVCASFPPPFFLDLIPNDEVVIPRVVELSREDRTRLLFSLLPPPMRRPSSKPWLRPAHIGDVATNGDGLCPCSLFLSSPPPPAPLYRSSRRSAKERPPPMRSKRQQRLPPLLHSFPPLLLFLFPFSATINN